MKKIIFLFLMFFTAMVSINAATGYYISDPIILSDGVIHRKSWNSTTDSYNCYNKITVTKKGYIYFYMTKPYASGELGTVTLKLVRENGTVLFEDYYSNDDVAYNELYYSVEPGDYYINIDPSFYVTSGAPSTEYYYKFYETNRIESEPNDSKYTANVIAKNAMYTAFFGGDDDDDNYSVNLTRGLKTRIYFDNFMKIDSTSIILDLYNPSNQDDYRFNRDNFSFDPARLQYYYEFVPNVSGNYVVRMYNYSGVQFKYGIGVYQTMTTNSSALDDVNKVMANKTADSVPVFRMYNPNSGEHLYTTDAYEVSVIYQTQGWGYEGVAWYASSSGTPVYRLYHSGLGNHLYTSDLHEISIITKQGWVLDFDGAPVMYSNGEIPIYRLYNQPLNGMHHLTTDANEYRVLPSQGWAQEGISLYANKIGAPSATEFFNVRF